VLGDVPATLWTASVDLLGDDGAAAVLAVPLPARSGVELFVSGAARRENKQRKKEQMENTNKKQ
jgi:hypothetical protein